MFPISESQRAIAITDPCALDQSLGEQGGDAAKTDLHLTSSNIPSYKVPALRQPGRVTPLMRGWCLTPASASLSQAQPTDSTLDSTPSPSFATLRRPNNDNTVVHRLSLPAGPGREGVCNSYCLLIQSQIKFSVPHTGFLSVTTYV